MHTVPYLLIKQFEGNTRDFEGMLFRTETKKTWVLCNVKKAKRSIPQSKRKMLFLMSVSFSKGKSHETEDEYATSDTSPRR